MTGRGPAEPSSEAVAEAATDAEGSTAQPWTKGPFLGFDLETTGKSRFSDRPVSFAFVEYRDGVTTPILRGYVNPGRPIPEGAQRVHGISDEKVKAEGMALRDATELLVEYLNGAFDDGVPIVGANLAYDLTMVNETAKEFGLPVLFDPAVEEAFNKPILDVIAIDRGVDQYRRGGRRLTQLAEHYGVEVKDAHDATGDVEMSIRVLLAQIAKFPELSGKSLQDLTPSQRVWREGFYRWFDGKLKEDGKAGLEPHEWRWPIAWLADGETEELEL